MRTKLYKELVKNKISEERAEFFYKKFRGAEFLGKGRHSVVLKLKEKVIKIEKDVEAAKKSAENEAYFLKIFNKHNIGPRFRSHNKLYRYVIYDYAKGKFLVDFLKTEEDERKKLRVIRTCFETAFIMDLLHINKEEMHRPLKHAIISKDVKFIDFERSRFAREPKNVSQLISFFFKSDAYSREIRSYKKNITREGFKRLLSALNLDKVPPY